MRLANFRHVFLNDLHKRNSISFRLCFYKLGTPALQAAWDKIQRFYEKVKIGTMKFGRQVLAETEVITITHTVEIAKATANAITRKKFCSGQKVLRPDSYIPRVFDWGE